MESTDTQPSSPFEETLDATDPDGGAMPDDPGLARYGSTAMESNIEPVAFDERVDLETRVYAILIAVMSCGGIGWICLCIGAGLNFLFS